MKRKELNFRTFILACQTKENPNKYGNASEKIS